MQTPTSTTTVGQKEDDIYDTLKEIKRRNAILKTITYSQFWKQTSNSQRKLLSSFDSEKRRMKMELLEVQIPEPKTIADYKKTSFEFDIKHIHSVDQMKMHKKTGEMISFTLTSTAMSLSKLQVTLSSTQLQLKMENISSMAKY